ncbi:cytochrome-c peroxidase [Pseudoroseicyclus tamaricis]|uniref:Cytochrome-c peroxidase n=1 Tax=Pseudoroseicyclus tamaricis TaxID=2705421 RepID=A0A6B2JPP6_9RHOB|nr:cytochrome c peroxidase [Pseudoroseicyclus tamaricis]NDV00657.1 cytochrome-c peroxidase [Pseudoroseicyclus tamaricis]
MQRVTTAAALAAIAFAAGLAWAESGPAERPAPLTDADFPPVDPAEAALGQLLFYDPVLSGGREVACATCHHPAFGTSDGLSLGLGDGGIGLGPARLADPDNPPEERVPRNAQGLWNVSALQYRTMFMDGRVEIDEGHAHGMRTPLEDEMLEGLTSMLSTQAMFPVVSPDEMAGHYQESEVSQAVRMGILTGEGGAWDLLARRVAAIPAYAERFREVYPQVSAPEDITFQDISNAIAAFMALEFRSDSAPFDAWLRGEAELTAEAAAGAEIFYGRGGCGSCHSGPFLTDHGFHAMGEVQIGPGKGARFESHDRDEGRAEVTGRVEDLYAFRTPSLRNVAHTAPYGHAGAHATLEGFLAAHADPVSALESYDRAQAVLPEMPVEDWAIMDSADERAAIAAAVTVPRVDLSGEDIEALVAFLGSLTDPLAETGRLGIPEEVPSGLPVPTPAGQGELPG